MKYREVYIVKPDGYRGKCGKMAFSKKVAQTKRNFLMKKGNARELRIYPCPTCNAWHLTHKV